MKEFKGFTHGVDLGGWFSQCDYSDDTFNNFITEKDIETIASWKLDHVRIPVDYNVLENEDGTYSEKGFTLIGNAVNMCIKHGLNAVIDLHKTAGFSFDRDEHETGFFDNAKYQERFYKLWEEIAKRFGKYAPKVAFELLNEVTDKDFMPAWNRISQECVRRIRKYAPDVVILIGGYWNNSVNAVKDIAPPADDKIVFNFHCYDPLYFTHQGATWIYNDDFDVNKRMSFEESDAAQPGYFEELFGEAVEYAKKHNTVLYCGEYGIIDRVGAEDTIKWYKAINSVFEKYNIGRAAWNYKKMDFGISDGRFASDIGEFIKYL